MSNATPEGWAAGSLYDYAEINPRLEQRAVLEDDTLVSFIRMEDVSNNASIENIRVVPYRQVSKGFTAFMNHDVLLAKITPCFENGKGGYAEGLHGGVGFGSTEFHVLRAKDNSNSRFLYQYTNYPTFRMEGEANMTGSAGQRRVPTEFLRTCNVVFPPLPEQQKIATILSSVDNVIEKTRAQIDKLKNLKTGMMQELLTKGIGHTEFKDSPVGRIPVSWHAKTLNEVSDRIWIGLVTTMTKHYVDNGVPLIRNSDIKEFSFRHKGMINLAYSFSEENKGRCFQIGDIATVHTGDVGTSAVIDERLDGAQGFATLNTRVNSSIITVEFLCEMLNSSILGAQIKQVVTGDGRDNLNLKDFVKLKLPVPSSLDEQKRIHEAIQSVRQKVAVLSQRLEVVSNTKNALMQDLITGKVRVNVEQEESVVA